MVDRTDDRRVFDRFPAPFLVKFKDSDEGFGRAVFLRDISADGARISTKERFLVNDKIDIELNIPDGKEPLALSGRVAWLLETNLNIWDFGVKFDKLDSKIERVGKSMRKEVDSLRDITERSFDNLEKRVIMKSDLRELEGKVSRIDIRVDEIHEVTVGLEQGEIQTGKSLRKLHKIVHRLQNETR